MAIQARGRVTFHKIQDPSYTFLRYSNDGGKTFTPANLVEGNHIIGDTKVTIKGLNKENQVQKWWAFTPFTKGGRVVIHAVVKVSGNTTPNATMFFQANPVGGIPGWGTLVSNPTFQRVSNGTHTFWNVCDVPAMTGNGRLQLRMDGLDGTVEVMGVSLYLESDLDGRNLLSGAMITSGENVGGNELKVVTSSKKEKYIVFKRGNTDGLFGPNQKYVLSADIRTNGHVSSVDILLYDNAVKEVCMRRINKEQLTTEYRHFDVVFSTKDNPNADWSSVVARFDNNESDTDGVEAELYVRNFQLTKGDKPCPYIPSPEDRQLGTMPGKYLGTLVWDKPYPSMDTSAYSWSEVKGKDGADAVSVLLSTELITVDTDDNGAVPPEALDNAYADVKAYRGNNPTAVTANVIGTSAPGIGAKAEADRIKITSIGVDPSTGYAYGSGYVDIDAIVAGTPYPLRLFVGTNLHKITSKWVQDTKNFRSELGELRKDYNGKKTQWDTAIRQNKEAIGLKVGKTEFDANNNMVSAQISQIKVESDSIRLSVEAIKGGARNLLVGSGFRKRDEVPWNGSDTYCSIVKSNGYKGSNAVYVNSTATAQAFAGVCFPKVPVKPSTRYSLSVMAMSPDISSFTAAASVEIREYTSDTEFTRIAAPSLIPDENGVYKTVKTAFTTRPDTRHLSVFFYVVKAGRLYICRPMLEEGEYKGWSLSENDFDYTGGNLLDGSRLLDGSNLVVKNGTVIEHGYGEFSAIHCDNTSGSSYVDVLQWSNDNNALGLKANTDYMLSMWVKGNGLFQSFLYGTEHATVYAEGSDGMSNSVSDGYTSAALTDTWKKVWVHWRTGSTVPRYILPVRLHKGNSATVAGVKLEEGATVTEYTESRTDMVSKQALLATGIDITNGHIRQVADHFEWVDNNGNPVAEFKDGTARFYGDVNARTFSTPNKTFTVDKDGNVAAKNMKAEGGTFSDVIVEGAVSSPYTTVGSGFNLTRHDNVWLGGNNEWANNFNLRWDVSQRGRTLHLSNYGTSLPTTGVGKINAPSGKWFFDNGRKFSQLLVYPGTVVVLHGLGDENTFHGWLVEQRHDPSHNKTGVPFRTFAWGFATCSKTGDADFENYRTFDGSRLGISRMGAGWCRITMPYAWYSVLQTYGSHWYHHFGVIATGYGYSEDGANEFCPIKASVKSMGLNGNTPYVDIWLSDDDTANDGRFQFIFYNMDWNDGFQTSDNR